MVNVCAVSVQWVGEQLGEKMDSTREKERKMVHKERKVPVNAVKLHFNEQGMWLAF